MTEQELLKAIGAHNANLPKASKTSLLLPSIETDSTASREALAKLRHEASRPHENCIMCKAHIEKRLDAIGRKVGSARVCTTKCAMLLRSTMIELLHSIGNPLLGETVLPTVDSLLE